MEYIKYLNKKLIENLYNPEMFSFTLSYSLQKFLNDFSFEKEGESYLNKKDKTFINVLTKRDNKILVWFISLDNICFVLLDKVYKELLEILENFYRKFSDEYYNEIDLLNTLIESCEYFLKHPEKITEI